MQTSQNLRGIMIIGVIAAFILAGTDAEKFYQCCTKVSTAKITGPITGYRMQQRNPPCVRAVIFETENGEFCIHVKQAWVINKILQFERSRGNTIAPISSGPHKPTGRHQSTPYKNCSSGFTDHIMEKETETVCHGELEGPAEITKQIMSDSRKLVVLAALFIVFGCLVSAQYRRPTKVTTQCCKSVTKKEIPYEIISFRRQNALHPCVNAIIFQTKNNGKVCTHPKALWVPKTLNELQKKTKAGKKP
ncbi:hypothetical protein GJAV_G00083630 [Gymnothorax javanicus]|nr:hypothetical protein GJAV_G00083630 [Gymnothorax javanicus]